MFAAKVTKKIFANKISLHFLLKHLLLQYILYKSTKYFVVLEIFTTFALSIIRCRYFENEGNVMTTTQVAAARAKNWIPGYAISENDWRDYEGSEPDPVFLRGDVNGDGVVNGTDIQEIINIIVNEE